MPSPFRIHPRAPEWIGAGGALLAGLALFLPWYATDPANAASQIDGVRGALSAWTVHEAMRYAILALAAVPLALMLGALRAPEERHTLAEAAMVIAVNGLGVVLYFGLIYRPGEPMLTISLSYGWLLALTGLALTLMAALYRVNTRASARRMSPVS